MSVCLSVCLCVCLSRSDRNWTGFETGYAFSRVVKHAKNTVFTTFLKKKDIFFAIFFKSFFLQSFLQSFLVSDSSSSRSSENFTKTETCNLELCFHAYYSRNNKKKTVQNVDDTAMMFFFGRLRRLRGEPPYPDSPPGYQNSLPAPN